MRFLAIIIFVTLTFNLSAQTDRRVIEMTGKIAEKYNIKMFLTINNQNVLGYYYYEAYKIKILLEGKIDGTKVTLNESPGIESEFKIGFIGDFNDNMITGSWIDKDKNKTLNFKALINSDKTIPLSDKIKNIEGNYENVKNSEKYDGSILLQNISDSLFCFKISTGLEDGCVGYLEGLIELKNLSTGIFIGSLCKELKIEIGAETITVSEDNCNWHGMGCSFEGKYKKNKKGSP